MVMGSARLGPVRKIQQAFGDDAMRGVFKLKTGSTVFPLAPSFPTPSVYMFLSYYQRRNFATIENSRQDFSPVYSNI
jgi:hypothetical protein